MIFTGFFYIYPKKVIYLILFTEKGKDMSKQD